jgi:hypothetical protein
VKEGLLTCVSVEFLRRKDSKGRQVNELVGGAFVNVPANPEARVLASKAGRRTSGADAAMLDAIHDAACHLGAYCPGLVEPVDVDDGASEGANRAAALRLRLKALAR